MNQLAHAKNTVKLNKNSDFRIPVGGPPANEHPEWGGTVKYNDVRIILHTPVQYEIAYCVETFVFVLPYSKMTIDLSLDDGPMRRVSMPARSGMMVPPRTTVRAKTLEPVEFLVVDVSERLMSTVIEDVFETGIWEPRPLLNVVDPAIAAIMCEFRRALLSDSLLERVYLRVACPH